MSTELQRVSLFGWSGMYLRRGCDADLLGSVRIVTSGAIKVHMISLAELKLADKTELARIGGLGEGAEPNTLTNVCQMMKSLTEDAAKKLATLAKAKVGNVGVNESLYVPPGWFVCTAAASGQVVSGFKKMSSRECPLLTSR